MRLKIYIYTSTSAAYACANALKQYYDVLGFVTQDKEESSEHVLVRDLNQCKFDAIFLPNSNFEEQKQELIANGIPIEKIRVYFRYATTGYLDQEMLLDGKTDPIIFDVGANIGQTIERYKNLLPHSKIYSFEPNGNIIPELTECANRYTNVEIINGALGKENGTLQLFRNEYSLYSSALPMSESFDHQLYADSPQAYPKEIIEVPIDTLDHFCRERKIEHIDILKIDTEGGEIDVLRGASSLVENHAIDIIYAEAYFQEKYAGQPLLYDLGAYLHKQGYVIYGMYHFVKKSGLPLLFCDATFISPNILARLEKERAHMLNDQN